ncbi:hypothetical protein LZC95_05265 [Pendulispora brunnea]|uniref:Uncharacterized protein n=1 Tax=Pendulispora brunnea TaxID=2905690 RepID=A0ABZ2KDV7_9BACT
MYATISLFTSFTLLVTAIPCAAQESKVACRDAYEESQVARKNGELLSARAKLRICAGETCPGIVRTDCIEWLGQVDHAIPSILVEAKSDEGDVFDVAVALDGRPIASSLDGRPIELDPGLHTVRFSREGKPSIEQKILVREGEKSRTLVANWRPPPIAPTEPHSPVQGDWVRPIPAPVFVLGGLGLAGIGGFATFAVLAGRKKQELADTCAPFCSADRMQAVRTDYLLADISLGIGIGALVGATLWFAVRPEVPRDEKEEGRDERRRQHPKAGHVRMRVGLGLGRLDVAGSF